MAAGRWSQTTAAVALPGIGASEATPGVSSAFDPPRERFAIGDELGRGGMGRVIAATDLALLRPVAIKQILSSAGGDRTRFEREVRITARLEHPSIVPIHDVGRDDQGAPYYVMRRIAGEPLGERIAALPELRARLALLPNLLAVIDAAAFAHARGIIHRDIKPGNILLGDYGETLLIDWGLARTLDAAPDASEGYGTPGFMSPEQARGEPVDARTDVHALGATLFYLLTRTTLLDGLGPAVWRVRPTAGVPPPLERIAREVPGELVAIVARAMAATPAGRYRDAGELAADLRRFLTGQLVAAHRYTVWQRVAHRVRRHRIAVTAAATALAAIAIASTLAIVNVVHERDRADAAGRLALDRGDQMLVERASALADHEPARAVALLATLPLASPYLARARDIAAVAAAGGIARGLVAHRGATRAIELAPDGHRLLSTGDDGAVRIHDLALGTSRTLVRDGAEGGYAIWTDGGATITYAAGHELRLVDVATGAVRALAAGVAIGGLWRADDHHVRYVEGRTHRLIERATAGTGEAVVAEEVTAAAGVGRAAIVDGEAELRAIDGEHVAVLVAHDRAHAAAHLAIAPDGRQLGAVVEGSVVAWQTATGRELARWAVGRVQALFHGPSCWFASARRNEASLFALCGSQPVEVLRGDWNAVWSVPAAHGVAFAATDGSLALLDATGIHRVAHHKLGTLAIAGGAGSPYVAIAASDGTVAWWDLAAIAPPPRAIASGSELVGADRTTSFLLAHDVLDIVAVGSGDAAPRALGAAPVLFAGPVDRAGRMVVTRIPPGGQAVPAILDTGSGRLRARPGASLVVGDRAGTTVVARDRVVAELRDGGERVVATLPDEVTMLAVAGRWAVAVAAARRLVRIDLVRAHSDELALWAAPDQVIAAGDGTVWFAIDRALWAWNGGWLVRAAVLPSPVTALVASGRGAAVVLLDRSLWFATAAGVTSRLGSGDPRALVFGERTVVVGEGNARQRIALASGERTVWQSDALQTSFAIGDGDRVLVVQTHDHQGDWLTRYADPVPADPVALRLWLAGGRSPLRSRSGGRASLTTASR